MSNSGDFIKEGAWIPENMHYTFNFHTYDGYRIFGRGWRLPHDKVDAKGIVCLVHGFGEHSGRYKHVAEQLLINEFEVIAIDLRGHGQSEGRRGDASRYKDMLEGVDQLVREARMRTSDLPVFLHGHCYGANLVLNYLISEKPEIQGAIVTSPWIKLNERPQWFKHMISRTFYKLLPRSYPENNIFDPRFLSHNEEVVKDYMSDSLVHNDMSVRFFLETRKFGLNILNQAAEIEIPVLLMHGTEDSITSAAASETLAKRLPERFTYLPREGMYHEIHNEVKWQEVVDDMIQWMEKLLEDVREPHSEDS